MDNHETTKGRISEIEQSTLLNKLTSESKTGKEQLTFNDEPLDFALVDFWRWSVSDIVSNATRGRFAEFIVAIAANIDINTPRDEWAAFDLETKDNIKIEVKSAAYIQTWHQKGFSNISFSTKAHSYQSNTEVKRHADVYVFCLLHSKDKQAINPLNMNQWEFYVMSTKELNNYKRSQHSITLKSLQNLTRSVSYKELNSTITNKSLLND